MKQILLALFATAALAAKAEDLVDLISLAVTNMVETTYSDDNGSVVTNIPSVVFGTGGFNSYNQWGVCWWDNRKDCAFDGFGWYEDSNGTTQAQGHVEFTSNEATWTGYQVSAAAVVSRIRFLSTPDPESDNGWVRAERTLGCSFQAANSADFSDAVTLYTVGDGGETKYSLTNGWQEVLVSSAQSFTYLRFYAPEGKAGGSIAEVEFYGQTWAEATSGTPSAAPQNFTAVGGADHVTLSWDLPSFPCQSVRVVRGTAPGGPFSTVATLPATAASYEDALSGLVTGVKYYYSACFLNTVGETEYKSELSASASFRRVEQLERTSLSDTRLKDGMSVIGYKWHVDTTGANAFDGDIATFADLNAEETDKVKIKIGVDLGAECVVTGFKVYPRTNNSLGARANGAYLAGSNDDRDIDNFSWAENPVALSPEMTGIAASEGTWYTFSTTNRTPCRFIYLMKPTSPDFYGNVAELALYGYTLASSQSVLLAPEDLAAEWHGTRAVVTWTASPNAASYRIERKWNDGAWETVSTVTGTEYTDASISKPTNGTYTYRIASIGENDTAAYTLGAVPTGTPSQRGLMVIFQ